MQIWSAERNKELFGEVGGGQWGQRHKLFISGNEMMGATVSAVPGVERRYGGCCVDAKAAP